MSIDTEMALILAEMRQDFIETAEDRLKDAAAALVALDSGEGRARDHMMTVKRSIHGVKGLGGTFGFPGVSTICHAIEDYIETSRDIGRDEVRDIQMFIDRIEAILERGEDMPANVVADMIHDLPLRRNASKVSALSGATRVLLLMPKGIQRKIVGGELSSFGFDVIIADEPIEAIDLALAHRPDIIVTGMQVGRLTGLELAHVFSKLEATFHALVLLVISTDLPAAKTRDLPPNVKILKKGVTFSRNLFSFMRESGFLQ